MKKEIRDKYEVVVGLEVHAQLLTATKIFNSDSASFGDSPNTNVSVITLGHPGTLPVLNKKVVEYAIRMGIACNSEIAKKMIFDRKNYFYPDLPKGYQITQDRTPVCVGGFVTIANDGQETNIKLNRIHLEEDAGKSMHLESEEDTLVDFNRAGVPLIEIVTEPVIKSSCDAGAFLSEVRKLVRYLEICDGNMEEGSLRCDANISIRPVGSKELGKKVEVKNMNSIKNVQRAIEFEVERQIELTVKGEEIISETRDFDANTGITKGMRTKEELNDYRYFPDPDISPTHISEEWLESIKADMPQLPRELYKEFISKYDLPSLDAQFLTETRSMANYYKEVCSDTTNYKAASNWMMGPVKSLLNDLGVSIEEFDLKPTKLAELIGLVDDNKVSFSIASQRLLPKMINSEKDVLTLAEELNLIHNSDEDTLGAIIDEVISNLPEKVDEYKKGKKGLLGMFVGEVMKKSGGKADPKKTNELLRSKLS